MWSSEVKSHGIWHISFNLSNDDCQPCGCLHPDEVISQDGGELHDCYLKPSVLLVDLFFYEN